MCVFILGYSIYSELKPDDLTEAGFDIYDITIIYDKKALIKNLRIVTARIRRHTNPPNPHFFCNMKG